MQLSSGCEPASSCLLHRHRRHIPESPASLLLLTIQDQLQQCLTTGLQRWAAPPVPTSGRSSTPRAQPPSLVAEAVIWPMQRLSKQIQVHSRGSELLPQAHLRCLRSGSLHQVATKRMGVPPSFRCRAGFHSRSVCAPPPMSAMPMSTSSNIGWRAARYSCRARALTSHGAAGTVPRKTEPWGDYLPVPIAEQCATSVCSMTCPVRTLWRHEAAGPPAWDMVSNHPDRRLF